MTKQNNKGFSHVEFVVVIIVVALIAGIGFTVYKRSSNNDYFNSAIAEGCPLTAQYAPKRQEHYLKNKATFLKNNGKSLYWYWKTGAQGSEKPDDIANGKTLKQMDLRLVKRYQVHPYLDEATLKERCEIEKKCGGHVDGGWYGEGNKIKYCMDVQRQKRLAKNLPGMKNIYSDGKGVTIKACRDSKTNPAKPIRFAVFDTYIKAKQIVAAYEKSHGIKFGAKPAPEGFTPERWKKITFYDHSGSDPGSYRNHAIQMVQKYLYNYRYPYQRTFSDTDPFIAELLFDSGKSRNIWSGKTNIASRQRIKSGNGLAWGVKRMPVGSSSTIYHYNKIEGYYKKENGNSNNPIVMFKLRYQTKTPKLTHYTDWTGTRMLNPNLPSPYNPTNSGGKFVTKKIKTRFKNLSVCGSKMFPATFYEMAKREGWDS